MTYEEYVEQRDMLGLTNNQVARLSGVSTATLSQWKKPCKQITEKIFF